MKIMSLIKSAKFFIFAAVLTAFLALTFSIGPASAAGVGIMKRGGEKNSTTEKSDKAKSAPGKSVERSTPSRDSKSNDAARGSSSRPDSRPGRSDSPAMTNRPDSNASRTQTAIQNRPTQESRTDNRPQRESTVRSGSSQAPVRPDSSANHAPSVIQNRPAQESRSDNRPQRGNSRDDDGSRTIVRPPSRDNSRSNHQTSTPEARTEDRRTIGTIFNRGRQETSDRPEVSRPRADSPTRTPSVERSRVERPSTVRSDNRPQRSDTSVRDRSTSATRVQRSPNRVIERVYETRRDWQTHYRHYDHKWRPRFQGGFYYYRGPVGLDPYYYGYYSFAYVPTYTYPSVYFYYGAFPYIYRDRVVVLARPARHYVFVTLDLNRIFYDDYYLTRDYIPYKGYVLSSSARQSLKTAFSDIEEAWENADNDRLMRHVVRGKRVDVFAKESYSYSINYEDYRDMTRDAMATIDTVDFEFTNIRMRSANEVVAYGRHNYYTSGDDYATIYVSYTLERMSGRWYITEVGSSPYSFDD